MDTRMPTQSVPMTSPWRRSSPLLVALVVAGLWSAPWPAAGQARFEGLSDAARALQDGVRYERHAQERRKAGDTEGANRAFSSALDQYRKAMELDPSLTEAHTRAGYVLYMLGRYDEAVELLGSTEAKDDPGVMHILGINLFKLGRYQQAIPLLRKAVTSNPDKYYTAAFLLGKFFYKKKIYEDARDFFKIYIKYSPDDHEVHGVLGIIYLKLGQYDAALKEFRRVMDLKPGDVRAQINVGNIYYKRGQYSEAAGIY